MRTVIEPYRIKVIEPIRFTTIEERRALLEQADFNLFKLHAEDVIIDLLTDSGTAAMSSKQWAGVMDGDESYAGARSYQKFEQAVQEFFGFEQIIPVHQGRAAERLLFEELLKPGNLVPSNSHFDTTRANIERLNATAIDLPQVTIDNGSQEFKGNIDLARLKNLLETNADRVPFGMLTLTNNARAGQPVSMDNVVSTSELLRQYGKRLYIDAARIAENAYFIHSNRAASGQRPSSITSIIRAIASYSDGCLMSCKKDGMANMGGVIALNDAQLAEKLRQSMVITEGFPTYGGLSGRDLEAIAIGLKEVTDINYLQQRFHTASTLCSRIAEHRIPVITPPAMHAIYVDASKFLAHLPSEQLPGQTLACELYIEAGIRVCEIGQVMFGNKQATPDLIRLALPRRAYTPNHYEYVAEVLGNIWQRRAQITGLQFAKNDNVPLRHFVAHFATVA